MFLDVSKDFFGNGADKERKKKKKKRERAPEKEKGETKMEPKRLSEQTKETERDDQEILSWMMAWSGAEDRCEEVCRCHHPSGDHGRPVMLYRLPFKRTPMMVPGGLRIACTTKSCHSGL